MHLLVTLSILVAFYVYGEANMNGMLTGFAMGVTLSVLWLAMIGGFAAFGMWLKPNPMGVFLGVAIVIVVLITVAGFALPHVK